MLPHHRNRYELGSAILSQDVETIERLLDQGADVDEADHNGITLLHIASMRNSSNIVQILINHGASINQLSCEGNKCYPPLNYDVDRVHKDIVKTLLSYNADANLRSKERKASYRRAAILIIIRTKKMEFAEAFFGDRASVNTHHLEYSSSDRVWVSYTPLHCVVMKGHDKLVKLLIDNGANVNAETSDPKWTPLQIAVKNGYVSITKMLLEHGANVEAHKDYQYLSPLCIAMEAAYDLSGLWKHVFEPDYQGINYRDLQAAFEIIINLLLEHRAVPDPKRDFFWKGLHGSVKMGNTTILERIFKSFPDAIDSSRDVGQRNRTLLHSAAYWWNVKSVEFLIRHGADVNAEDSDGRTPIFYVVMTEHQVEWRSMKCIEAQLKTAELLLGNGADINYRAKNMETPLFYAVDMDDYEMAHWLLMHNACVQGYMAGSQGSPNRLPEEPNFLPGKCLTLLNCAVKSKSEDFTKLVLSKCRDVNITNDSMPLYSAIDTGNDRIVKLLLDHGFYVDVNDQRFKSTLFMAVCKEYLTTIEHIFESNPDINVIVEYDNDGRTLLHGVGCNQKTKLVELLIKHGCDVNAPDMYGKTPLLYALDSAIKIHPSNNLHIVQCLLEHGAHVDPTAKHLETTVRCAIKKECYKHIDLLLKNCSDVKVLLHANGSPLLHTASEVGSAKVTRVLMKNGASVNATDESGKTALHLAALKDHKTVEMLIEYGADVNRRDNRGKTALHIAVGASDIRKNLQIVPLLLKYGADVNITSNANFTALDYAFRKQPPSMTLNKNLITHVIKMTAANRFVSQHLQSMDLCGSNKDLYNTCKAEYEKMRETKIDDTNLRFSDILTGIHYARNETVVTTLESYDYEAKFPRYSDWIDHNFKRAQKRVYLLNQSATFSNSLLGYEVPEIVAMKVFSHLSNFDLQNLIEAHTNDISEKSYEIHERNKRKNNVIVKGFRVKSRDNMEKEVKGFLQELAGNEVKLKSVRELQDEGGNTYLVKFAEFTSKMLIMKQKKMLKGRNVFIENDLTERQQEIQKLLIERAKKEKAGGHRACVGYMKLWLNDREFEWNEDTEKLEERRTGEKDEQGRK